MKEEIFFLFSFNILEGSPWERSADAIICDLHVANSKNGLSWVKAPAHWTWELATCPSHLALTLRTSATCQAGATQARGLIPFRFGTLVNSTGFY